MERFPHIPHVYFASRSGKTNEVPTALLAVEDCARNLGGRPTVKTLANRERILAEIRLGTPKTCAAVYCGIGRRTFHEWENEDYAFAEAVQAAERAYFYSLRKPFCLVGGAQ